MKIDWIVSEVDSELDGFEFRDNKFNLIFMMFKNHVSAFGELSASQKAEATFNNSDFNLDDVRFCFEETCDSICYENWKNLSKKYQEEILNFLMSIMA